MNKVLFSSNTDSWSTPQELFDKLNSFFDFTLDPCADHNNHKCEKYYTKAENGLIQDWSNERVFCNPPYGRDISKWVKKCYDEIYFGNCELIVLLIPARTDTIWFHEYIYQNAHIIPIKGRLKFGGCSNSAPFPSLIVIYDSMGYME